MNGEGEIARTGGNGTKSTKRYQSLHLAGYK
jgi:hypothetical protein